MASLDVLKVMAALFGELEPCPPEPSASSEGNTSSSVAPSTPAAPALAVEDLSSAMTSLTTSEPGTTPSSVRSGSTAPLSTTSSSPKAMPSPITPGSLTLPATPSHRPVRRLASFSIATEQQNAQLLKDIKRLTGCTPWIYMQNIAYTFSRPSPRMNEDLEISVQLKFAFLLLDERYWETSLLQQVKRLAERYGTDYEAAADLLIRWAQYWGFGKNDDFWECHLQLALSWTGGVERKIN